MHHQLKSKETKSSRAVNSERERAGVHQDSSSGHFARKHVLPEAGGHRVKKYHLKNPLGSTFWHQVQLYPFLIQAILLSHSVYFTIHFCAAPFNWCSLSLSCTGKSSSSSLLVPKQETFSYRLHQEMSSLTQTSVCTVEGKKRNAQ